MSVDLETLARDLAPVFANWVQVDLIDPLPTFRYGEVGPDTNQPRFGVSQPAGQEVILVGPAYSGVLAGLLLREIVVTYFPASFRVDIVYELVNRFCSWFFSDIAPGKFLGHDPALWHALVHSHSRRYFAYYLGGPIITDLELVPGGFSGCSALFRTTLEKARHFAPTVPADQVTDVLVTIISPVINAQRRRAYSPEDVEFIKTVSDYMASSSTFPDLQKLARAMSLGSSKKFQETADRLADDQLSPTYAHNPAAFDLVLCGLLLETSPTVSHYLARQLFFLPFATLSFAQLPGCPVPTYLTINLLSADQLVEFGTHLQELKSKGVLLDYQIFRAVGTVDFINWGLALEVSLPTPAISRYVQEFITKHDHATRFTPRWQRSWLMQQMLHAFGLRKIDPRALTHFNPQWNYANLLRIVQGAGLLAFSDLKKDLARVTPLLARYRNIQYVLRLLSQGTAFLRQLFAQTNETQLDAETLGKLGVTWMHFPAKEWLLNLNTMAIGDRNSPSTIVDQLNLCSRMLSFFAPCTVPAREDPLDFLRAQQIALIQNIRQDLAELPANDEKRFRYLTDLHAQVVESGIMLPKVTLSIFYPPNMEEFSLLARVPARSWEEISDAFLARVAPHAAHCLLWDFSDQSGARVLGGLLRTTYAHFQTIRRTLVGPDGILGPKASLLVGRKVSSWDYTRRNFTEMFDPTTSQFASIKEYLTLVRGEHLSQWITPRKPTMPFARQILAEPFTGGVEKRTREPSRVTQLTPTLVRNLKQSFLGGIPALHNLAEHTLRGQWTCDLNWPAYGLDRYFLHAYLSTRQPKYIYSHLVTPATRRVLASTAVSGFQTVLIEYLWPKNAPDDKFLRYLYSRTEQNVLAYSVHRVLVDTRFFNLDQLHLPEGEDVWDGVDLQILAFLKPRGSPDTRNTFVYAGDVTHSLGSPGWELATGFFSTPSSHSQLPPDSRLTFDFDPRTIGFTEKTALIFRGNFDALPLYQALPFGHYYQTEETFYKGTERLTGQPGHVILFDFPAMRVAQVNLFLDDILRNPSITAPSINSYLAEQSLRKVQNLDLTKINPLRCNPWDSRTSSYFHLPKRVLREGKWHTTSLKEQMTFLNNAWTSYV